MVPPEVLINYDASTRNAGGVNTSMLLSVDVTTLPHLPLAIFFCSDHWRVAISLHDCHYFLLDLSLSHTVYLRLSLNLIH